MKRTLLWCLTGMLLCVAARSQGMEGYVDHNVVIVLDASGSMSGKMQNGDVTRMQAAKDALLDVLTRIPENTHVGILVFSARNVKVDWIYPLGPVDQTRLADAVNRPFPGGSTPLGRYIKKGADALLSRRAQQFGYGTYRLIVVTDGEAGDANLVEQFVPDILSRGIIVDAIGVDMDQDHTLATKVHSYRSADDPQALTLALESVFAEIGGSTESDITPETAFDEIVGLPDEVAWAMLNALMSSGNHPVGEIPGAAPPRATGADGGQMDASSSGSPVSTSVASDSGSSAVLSALKIVTVLVVILLFVAVKGLKRK